MKKFLILSLGCLLLFAIGCSKEEAPAPTGAAAGGSHGASAPGGNMMPPPPAFIPNAGANWKAAKISVTAKDGSEEKTLELDFDATEATKVTVAGVTISVKAVEMVPDFVMSGTNIGSRSTELNNPAVQLIITEEGKEPVKQWLFEKMPSVNAYEHEKIAIATTGFVEKAGAGEKAGATEKPKAH